MTFGSISNSKSVIFYSESKTKHNAIAKIITFIHQKSPYTSQSNAKHTKCVINVIMQVVYEFVKCQLPIFILYHQNIKYLMSNPNLQT